MPRAEIDSLRNKLPAFFGTRKPQPDDPNKSGAHTLTAPGASASAPASPPSGNGAKKGPLESTLAFIPNPLAQWHPSRQHQQQQQEQQARRRGASDQGSCDAALAMQLQQEEDGRMNRTMPLPDLSQDSAIARQLAMEERQEQQQPQYQYQHQPRPQANLMYPATVTQPCMGNSYELVCERMSRTPSYGLTLRVNSFIPRPSASPEPHISPDRDRLLLRLDQYDLTETEVVGDGACQFRSLSDQLYGSQEHHLQVRQSVLEQLQQYPERYSMYVPSEYDVYCMEMAKAGTWGDHVTLQAAADVYGLLIMVLTSFKQESVIKIQPIKKRSERVLWLSFWAEVHYNSIYPCAAPPVR